MNTKDFVSAIKRHVRDAAIDDTVGKLKNPPGRRVSPEKKLLSEWYNGLASVDAKYVNEIVENAVDETIFGVFAILDGSRVIDDGTFELFHVNEERTLLNDPDTIGLNEIFNSED